jgi:phage protein D
MTAVDKGVLLPLVEIKVDGKPLESNAIQEIRVQDSLGIPRAFSITFAPADLSPGADPILPKLKLGAAIVIMLAAPSSRSPVKIFEGEVTALEPTFGPEGVRQVASGYAREHRLHRARKTRTFQEQTSSEIVRKLAGEAGLTATVDETTEKHHFFQQNNETDYELIKRLASMHDFEAHVDGGALLFKRISDSGDVVELTYGRNVTMRSVTRLHSFYPRLSSAQQPSEVVVRSWDPIQKENIEGKAKVEVKWTASGDAKPAPPGGGSGVWAFSPWKSARPSGAGAAGGGTGIDQRYKEVAAAFGEATLTIANAPVSSLEGAKELATSVATYFGGAFATAWGTCEGDPRLRAGTTVNISGLGPDYSGKYRVTAVTHTYGGPTGYTTTFEVTGRLPRELPDLARTATKNTWGKSLVVGIVTNNKYSGTPANRPDKKALVRVKYPTLDGGQNEGAWARVVAVGAGKDRGQLMLPQVGDEVLIGFENGDPHRPYVLGALWNGKDLPKPEHISPKDKGEDPDGSYALRSPKHIWMEAVEEVTLHSGKNMTVTVDEAKEVTVKKTFKLDAADELTLICGQAKIVLKKDGTITIEGGNVTMNGQTGTTVKGAKVDVQGQGQVSVQANGMLTVKGATVAIN